MTPGKVEVVAPVKVAEHKIHQFVQSKREWIVRALAKIAAKSQQHKTLAPAVYGHGAEIPYQGVSYKLAVRPTKLKRIKIEFSQEFIEFIAHVPDALMIKDHSAEIKEALIRWMKKESKSQVEQLVNRHAEKKQLFPQTIKIKTQKSRWGSCGIHNDININWLLIIAPLEVLEYVVVHELCHIKIRNHSAHFWALVAEHLPDYQSRRYWLKKHGSSLMMGL
ncbi:SprT family zinc-dependent metalloprotease [Methylobacter sp. G7]|uniref:M48 family metallopeptidase n=1 Tax=Methylobacter sp. G7 TaxID=3230117 RepID=UPI003D8093FD